LIIIYIMYIWYSCNGCIEYTEVCVWYGKGVMGSGILFVNDVKALV